MKVIKLRNSELVALVDDGDYERIGRYCWHLHDNGGAFRSPRSGTVYMHRVILDAPDGMDVDHKDRDRLNNQRWNLRLATGSQNNANSAKRGGCTSRFKGVHWRKDIRKWAAQINIHGKKRYLGSFSDEVNAAASYNAAAEKQWGEFARVNALPTA